MRHACMRALPLDRKRVVLPVGTAYMPSAGKTVAYFPTLCYDEPATQSEYLADNNWRVFLSFGKNASFIPHAFVIWNTLCRSKWSYAFFGA